MLRVIAGPDGIDPYVREMPIGDPADVSIAGMRVLLSEDTSYIKVSRELRAARQRAAEALEAAGATIEVTPLKSMKRALELYLAVLKLEAGVSVRDLIVAEGSEHVTVRKGLRAQGPAHARAAAAAHERVDDRQDAAGPDDQAGRRARGVRARGRRHDRRRRAAAPDAPARRAEARPDDRQAVAAHDDRGLQPRRRPGRADPARPQRPRPAARRAGRRRPGPRPRRGRRRARARARARRLGPAAARHERARRPSGPVLRLRRERRRAPRALPRRPPRARRRVEGGRASSSAAARSASRRPAR